MVNLPRWQRILIVMIMALGVFFAFPNSQYSKVEKSNDAIARIEIGKPEAGDDVLSTTWPDWLPNRLVNLGLDLRGGVHVLVQVEKDQVYNERYDEFWGTIRDELRDNRDRFGAVRREATDTALRVKIANESEISGALEKIQQTASDLGATEYNFAINDGGIDIALTELAKSQIDELTMARSLEIVRRRIDAAGTKEPTIQRVGDDRVSIDVPGFGSVEEVMTLLGKTAKLTLHEVLEITSDQNLRVGFDQLLLPSVDGPYYRLDKAAVVSGASIVDASLGFDQAGQPAVNFRLNTEGAKKFGDFTSAHIEEPFAIVLDGEVLSAPNIQSYIPGGQAIISGNFTTEEATNLAVLLRSGALPAPLTVLEQSVVGPDLGQDSVDAGRMAAMIALFAVAVYMLWVYRAFGVFANISLFLNMILIIAGLSLIGSTLTLPGIAGIVLTVGMAVDANVLIFERIREEYDVKPVLIRAIDQGFARALSSILDGNITTLIAAAVLYFFGAGPVRGFAITLMIGIVTSVFTAVYGTRLLMVLYLDWRKPKDLGY